jgi:hypothetical protein
MHCLRNTNSMGDGSLSGRQFWDHLSKVREWQEIVAMESAWLAANLIAARH